jgi:hypothetical protein
MKTATKSRSTTAIAPAAAVTDVACCHHWLLGQPLAGHVPAVCRKCGVSRDYPAVLDDLDPPAEPEKAASADASSDSVATAAGGARPSSIASPRKL